MEILNEQQLQQIKNRKSKNTFSAPSFFSKILNEEDAPVEKPLEEPPKEEPSPEETPDVEGDDIGEEIKKAIEVYAASEEFHDKYGDQAEEKTSEMMDYIDKMMGKGEEKSSEEEKAKEEKSVEETPKEEVKPPEESAVTESNDNSLGWVVALDFPLRGHSISEIDEKVYELLNKYNGESHGSGAGLGYRDFTLYFDNEQNAKGFMKEIKKVRGAKARIEQEEDLYESYYGCLKCNKKVNESICPSCGDDISDAILPQKINEEKEEIIKSKLKNSGFEIEDYRDEDYYLANYGDDWRFAIKCYKDGDYFIIYDKESSLFNEPDFSNIDDAIKDFFKYYSPKSFKGLK